MVAGYFHSQSVGPVILHSDQFLREYEAFWKDPAVAPYVWVALLFSILCLATQYQLWTGDSEDPLTLMRLQLFRERTVQCLVLGQYTRGGAHVLEALVNYSYEMLFFQDADIGVWLVLGMIVQLALSMGYHRDPRNFPRISPFDSEMRRRVWAAIMQLDLRLSNQMGLPRLLKPEQSDTAEPRNLFDSDFDADTIELPPSRPETEVTPVLFVLAKNRIDCIGDLISDLIANTKEHTYREIMELDQKLREAEASFPTIFRWQPLTQSFMVSPQIIMRRIWLKLTVNRLMIGLHRKYITQSNTQSAYQYSRKACIDAAVNIIELQLLFNEETRPSGLLNPLSWLHSSMLQSVFLLGMSVLCYYIHLANTTPQMLLNEEMRSEIVGLLRKTYPIWLRSSTTSRDAKQAFKHLKVLLETCDSRDSSSLSESSRSKAQPSASPETVLLPNQSSWDDYQDFITNFPMPFDTNFVPMNIASSPSAASSWRHF
ncbi:fungal-specific transcription factor domain-containing protein [Xylariales sp. PMI_506]|nr:fungal-specific transcription factor domain-containing protein [Xylariales sp. PMI_506]